jgi:hypothetical protein
MRRHFSRALRSRRAILPLEEIESPRKVTHLTVAFATASRNRRAHDNRPLGTELEQLRARLLRLIVENESTRRATKSYC